MRISFSVMPFLQPETFLRQTVFVVFAEEHRFAVLQIDGVLGASFLIIYRVVRAVVEDDAVLEDFAHRGALVPGGGLQDIHRTLCVRGHGAGKEASACAEAQLCRMEGVFHRAVRR